MVSRDLTPSFWTITLCVEMIFSPWGLYQSILSGSPMAAERKTNVWKSIWRVCFHSDIYYYVTISAILKRMSIEDWKSKNCTKLKANTNVKTNVHLCLINIKDSVCSMEASFKHFIWNILLKFKLWELKSHSHNIWYFCTKY